MNNERILVLDFGGQYNQLIARRVRECSVYSEIYPNTISIEKIKEYKPAGIIFTGGPNSVYEAESPTISKEIFEQLFEKAVGEIGLNIDEFYSMSPHEIDSAYHGYLMRQQLEANCFLIALRKSQDNKATLISLLGGNGYSESTQTEREKTFKALGIE